MNHAVRDATTATATSAPEALAAWDAASSIPTLVGSLLSLVATALVILLWTFAGGKKRRDFRYALILNLTVAGTCFPSLQRATKLTLLAEFFNCLNNSVSGIAVVARRRPLLPGTACEVNGWAGQFSVQVSYAHMWSSASTHSAILRQLLISLRPSISPFLPSRSLRCSRSNYDLSSSTPHLLPKDSYVSQSGSYRFAPVFQHSKAVHRRTLTLKQAYSRGQRSTMGPSLVIGAGSRRNTHDNVTL